MHNLRNTSRHTGFLMHPQIPLKHLWRIIPPTSRKGPPTIPVFWTPWLLRINESPLSREMQSSRHLVDSSSMLGPDSNLLGHFVSLWFELCNHHDLFVCITVNKRLKYLPVLGSVSVASEISRNLSIVDVSFQVHISDILNVYGDGEMTDYLVRFVANLDPNGNTGINWPQYTPSSPNLLTFLDWPVPLAITQDTFRQEAIAYLTNVTLANPI